MYSIEEKEHKSLIYLNKEIRCALIVFLILVSLTSCQEIETIEPIYYSYLKIEDGSIVDSYPWDEEMKYSDRILEINWDKIRSMEVKTHPIRSLHQRSPISYVGVFSVYEEVLAYYIGSGYIPTVEIYANQICDIVITAEGKNELRLLWLDNIIFILENFQ